VITEEQGIDALREQLRARDEKIAQLTFQLEQLKRLIYGTKSERFVPDPGASSGAGQVTLFEMPQGCIPPIERINCTRTKPTAPTLPPVRMGIAAHIPRIERVIQPEQLPENAKKIGEEITETLEYVPATIHVDKLVRPKYVSDERVYIAPMPSMPFPKSNLGAGLAAHICVSKFCDHLPLYRQRGQLNRAGLEVSDSTMCDWFKSAATLLEPLGDALRKEVLAQDYLQVDESPIPVQRDHQEGSLRTGYHWVYHAPLIKAVFFDYRPGRSAEFPAEILSDFQGALQTDGYGGYEKLVAREGIQGLACMAHARRKFEAALINDKARAAHALGKIGECYAIERHCQDQQMDHPLRHRYREKHAVPILDELHKWLKQEIISAAPKSPIGAAIAYALSLWPRLRSYTLDGRYLIDNNRIENTIRPLAIGRKNYLFAGSDRGARHAALMYSLLGTCKLHDVEPFAYLRDVISSINDHKANALTELLPQNWQPLAT
jgi:transposase